MNIILNFIPLKEGGGVQVGLDFLNQAKLHGGKHTWHVVATRGTPFIEYNYSNNIHLKKIINNNLVERLLFEYFGCKKIIKSLDASAVYTQFGPVWPGSDTLNIAGCAYSNLMYPEIDFWGNYPFLTRLKCKLIDYFRTRRMLTTDYIIYETQDLANRAVRLFNLDFKRVFFVRPSPSSLLDNIGQHSLVNEQIKKIPDGFKILLLSHYRIHKNFELLPKIAYILKNKFNISNVIFVITLENDNNALKIINIANQLGVENNICNIGSVAYDSCGVLYKFCDAVILPSLLESFSNTIAEAWSMKKPLLISDLDWAHSICEKGALYIKYADAEDAAKKISLLYNNPILNKELVNNGINTLKKYPDPKSRFLAYQAIIENAINANE